jgi:hypothetical protein
LPRLREIVPLREGIIGKVVRTVGKVGRAVGHHARNVVRNYHVLRYRAASARKVLGMSRIKQKVKSATGINFVQRWTDKNRLKQRFKSKIGWYNNRAMTKYREFKNHRYVRTFNNMEKGKYPSTKTRANHTLRFSKLRPKDKSKARVHSKVRRVKGFKPPKQALDLAKR